LESIVHQDYEQIEVIVMDGASTDGTHDLVTNFSRDYSFISSFTRKDDGVYDAINHAIGLAHGEWIYILGCDDRLAGTGVLTAISPLFTTAADFIHTKVIRMSTGQKEGSPVSRVDIVLKNICQQAIFYRRSLFERVGNFDLQYPICADWEFNIRCFGIPCNPTFFDVVLCQYDGRGMSSQITDHHFYRNRLSITIEAFGLPVLDRVFQPLRDLFRDESRYCLSEKRLLAALRNQVIFIKHALMTKLALFSDDDQQ
jgi:hypothetical protein